MSFCGRFTMNDRLNEEIDGLTGSISFYDYTLIFYVKLTFNLAHIQLESQVTSQKQPSSTCEGSKIWESAHES